MRCPAYFSVRANLHALLSVSHLLPVEVYVAQVKHAAEYFEYRVLLVRRETQHLHRREQRLEVAQIIFAVDLATSTLKDNNNFWAVICLKIYTE